MRLNNDKDQNNRYRKLDRVGLENCGWMSHNLQADIIASLPCETTARHSRVMDIEINLCKFGTALDQSHACICTHIACVMKIGYRLITPEYQSIGINIMPFKEKTCYPVNVMNKRQ